MMGVRGNLRLVGIVSTRLWIRPLLRPFSPIAVPMSAPLALF